MSKDSVANIVVAVAREMEELLRLREENRRLRIDKRPAQDDWQRWLEGSPVSITQDDSGRWSYHIAMRNYATGGSLLDSYEDAFKSAMSRFSETVFARDYEDEDDE